MYAADVKREASARGWNAAELSKRTGLKLDAVNRILEGPDYMKLRSAKEKLFTDIFNWNIDRHELLGFDASSMDALAYAVCITAVKDYCKLKEGILLEDSYNNYAELVEFFEGDVFALFAPSVNGHALLEKLDTNKDLRLSIIRMPDEEDD